MTLLQLSDLKIQAICTFFILFCVQICAATPVIDSVSVTVSTITITSTATNFTTKTTAAPLKWDTFESGTNTNDLSGWTLDNSDGSSNPEYSNHVVHAGLLSAMANFNDGAYLSSFQLTGDTWGELFISFYYRPEYVDAECYDSQPNRNFKILRVEGDNGSKTGDQGEGVPLFAIEHRSPTDGDTEVAVRAQYDPSLIADTFYGGDLGWEQNAWNKVEIYANVKDGERTFKMWENGVDKSPSSTTLNDVWVPDMGDDGSEFNEVKFGFYFDSSSTYGSCRAKVYFDDVYIDNSQARVEIGNSDTWAACTEKEIQIPTVWTTSSITVTINQGAFDTLDGKYLYVIDSDGVVNTNGYPIQTGTINGLKSMTGGTIQ